MSRKKPTWMNEICDTCINGKWNCIEWNFDYLGRPITLRCKNYKDGKVGIIRGSQACQYYAYRGHDDIRPEDIFQGHLKGQQ